MSSEQLRPARRFLHVCYCCVDAGPVKSMLVDTFAMRNTMSTPVERNDGRMLGLPGDMVAGASFVYDARGPRQSPAIEVQDWVEPPMAGAPPADPAQAGIQAIGLAVPDLAAVTGSLLALGCTVVGEGAPFGERWTILRDVTGVTLDLREDATVPAGEARLRHLRVTVTDLSVSLPWYDGLGFEVVDKGTITDGQVFGLTGEVQADVVRLRLPDEPFEAVLVEWQVPAAHGRHVTECNHAGLFRCAIGVDDTRASHAAMVDAGYEFSYPPVEVELHGTPVPDMWICFLSDPDGVPFEFVERPRSAFR